MFIMNQVFKSGQFLPAFLHVFSYIESPSEYLSVQFLVLGKPLLTIWQNEERDFLLQSEMSLLGLRKSLPYLSPVPVLARKREM